MFFDVTRFLQGIAFKGVLVKACFRTVIALILNGQEHLFEGRVDGEILPQQQGEAGFGYDPIFRPEGYRESFAEMPMEEKNKISHRGKATRQLAEFLKTAERN